MIMSFFIMFSFVLILVLILLALGVSLSMKFQLDREKLSPFECGFTPKSMPRLPLSLRFFLVAIIFLIFDVELVLLFPIVSSIANSLPLVMMLTMSIFLIILMLGLYYEINQGSLNWAN